MSITDGVSARKLVADEVPPRKRQERRSSKPREEPTKPAERQKAGKAPTFDEILAEAATMQVAPNQIDAKDSSYQFRIDDHTGGDPDSFSLNTHGVFDGTAGSDPIVLLERSGKTKHTVLSGRWRLAALRKKSNLRWVSCYVLRNVPDVHATIIAARANQRHGNRLSDKEKFECFRRDYPQLTRAGLKINKSALAEEYLISRQTFYNWVGKIEGCEAKSVPTGPSRNESVNILHSGAVQPGCGVPTTPASALPATTSAIVTEVSGANATLPIAEPSSAASGPSGASSDSLVPDEEQADTATESATSTNNPADATPDRASESRRSAHDAREAVAAHKGAVAMLTVTNPDQLRPHLPDIRAEMERLSEFLISIDVERAVST